MSARRLVVGPFNRVEGDLEVALEVRDGAVQSARVCAPMYRGFEQMLSGRLARDALVYVPRICGICSVAQSLAAARALAALQRIEPPPNGRLVQALVGGTENLADHLSHFYLFFMPDFLRPVYRHHLWYASVVERHDPVHGTRTRAAIAARQHWFGLMGTLTGRWPHTQGLEPGGTTRALDPVEVPRLRARVAAMRRFLEAGMFGRPLEQVAEARCLDDFCSDDSDAGRFIQLARDTGLFALGRGPGVCLSFGAYPVGAGGTHALPAGVWRPDGVLPADLAGITEDVTSAWFLDEQGPRHPAFGQTEPLADKPGAYSWNKAPRLHGAVVETGALARQLVAGQPLVCALVAEHGAVVATRVVARLLELARLARWMDDWLCALDRHGAWCNLPDARTPGGVAVRTPGAEVAVRIPDGSGVGLTEAARGALGHWVSVADGRITRYQIIAPTSWNFSPRDAHGVPGALEQALQGAPVLPEEDTPVSVQHIVRSFDPCMVCTVH